MVAKESSSIQDHLDRYLFINEFKLLIYVKLFALKKKS